MNEIILEASGVKHCGSARVFEDKTTHCLEIDNSFVEVINDHFWRSEASLLKHRPARVPNRSIIYVNEEKAGVMLFSPSDHPRRVAQVPHVYGVAVLTLYVWEATEKTARWVVPGTKKGIVTMPAFRFSHDVTFEEYVAALKGART